MIEHVTKSEVLERRRKRSDRLVEYVKPRVR